MNYNDKEWTRRDVYGMRVNNPTKQHLKALAAEFEYKEYKKIIKSGEDDPISEDLNEHSEKELKVNEFKKQWLSRYGFYKERFELINEEIDEIRERGNKLVSKITGIPRGGHSSKPEDEWISIIENTDTALDYLCTVSEKLLYTLLEIETTIQKIEEPELQLLLTMRYIKGLPIKEIQKRMHYSRSHVWKLEGRALKRLEIDCTEKELEERMEREYRFLEFQQDHFDPNKVDPYILDEYIKMLKEDRDEAQKLVDRNMNSRKLRVQRQNRRKDFKEQKEAVKNMQGE